LLHQQEPLEHVVLLVGVPYERVRGAVLIAPFGLGLIGPVQHEAEEQGACHVFAYGRGHRLNGWVLQRHLYHLAPVAVHNVQQELDHGLGVGA